MKRILIALFAIFSVLGLKAQSNDYLQDPKWGKTPEERKENATKFSLLNVRYEVKDYATVLELYKQLVNDAPTCSTSMYGYAAYIYKLNAMKARTKNDKLIQLDSMAMVYDQRVAAFGDDPDVRAEILATKARQLFGTGGTLDPIKSKKYLRDAIDANTKGIDTVVAKAYFNLLTESFKVDLVTPEDYIEAYELISQRIQVANDPEISSLQPLLNAVFGASGAASCDNIERIFRPKYEADPNNEVLIIKILKLYDKAKCSTDFQYALLEKYYQIDPKPAIAAMLAATYEQKEMYDKALDYWIVAISKETDTKEKVNQLIRASGASLNLKNYRRAAEFASEAISLDNSASYAYFFYANALAGGVGSSCSDFDRQTAYWIVVDAFVNARNHMKSDDPQFESVNRSIGQYASNFPKSDELFMRGVDKGKSYRVNCGWISGNTTARTRD